MRVQIEHGVVIDVLPGGDGSVMLFVSASNESSARDVFIDPERAEQIAAALNVCARQARRILKEREKRRAKSP